MSTIEDDLRDALREAEQVAAMPGLAEHMLRRIAQRRARRRLAATGLAVLVGLAGVAAVAGGLPGRDRSTRTVAAGGQCGGLSVVSLGAGTAGSDSRRLAVVLTNTSPGTVCRVGSSELTVHLRAGGQRLDVAQLPPARVRAPLELTGRRFLNVEVEWDNWCAAPVDAARLTLELPDGQSVTTKPFQPSPDCRDPAAPSTIRVFQVGLVEVSSAASPSPGRVCADPPATRAPGTVWKPGVACLPDPLPGAG